MFARSLSAIVVVALLFSLTLAAPNEDRPNESPDAVTPPKTKPPAEPAKTNNKAIDGYLRAITDAVQGGNGRWGIVVDEVPVLVVTDEKADRMRIITPVADAAKLKPADLQKMMAANFHSALDARYAISNGQVWSAYIHPLSPLTQAQFNSGIKQVVALKKTYGTTYSSLEIVFGGGDQNAEPKQPDPEKVPF